MGEPEAVETAAGWQAPVLVLRAGGPRLPAGLARGPACAPAGGTATALAMEAASMVAPTTKAAASFNRSPNAQAPRLTSEGWPQPARTAPPAPTRAAPPARDRLFQPPT